VAAWLKLRNPREFLILLEVKRYSRIYILFVENPKHINIHIKLTKHNNLIYIICFLI
jgi:ribosomal protein L36